MSDMHTIHETIIRDIFDVAKDFKDSDEVERVKGFKSKSSIKSITSKAEALTMVFPVICSRNMPYDAACMISKAIERKAVTLLQMLFSAANITDAEDGIDYISRFHTNLGGRMSVDDFMDAMDTFVDENGLLQEGTIEYADYKKIQEDMKAMNFYFECDENINDIPLDAYKIVSVGESGSMFVNTVLNEDKKDDEIRRLTRELNNTNKQLADANNRILGYEDKNTNLQGHVNSMKSQIDALNIKLVNKQKEHEYQQQHDEKIDALNVAKEKQRRREKAADYYQKERQMEIERNKAYWANRKAAEDILKIQADIMRNRLVDNDVKKANELVPTLMYVNFISKGDSDQSYPIATSMVVGVKAKLYAVDGQDIMNRLKIKHNDRNTLLNLVKVSTREISFFKDFLFCIDKAKIDALSQSRRGSSNKIWKILERRANKSKFRRFMNMKNDATAISTLCITQDEVEFLRKTEYIDVENFRVIRPIMDAYNLMGFVIADDAMEICKFMFDTEDDQYEVLTYDNLEREQRDNTKKILNLMSKMR